MADDPTNDTDDVAATLAGDREAFGRLYDRHARRVRAIVAAVSADWPSVEDQTQETFLRAYRRLASLRKPAGFGPWIAGVARLVARERRRALRRDRHEFVGETDGVSSSDAPHAQDEISNLMNHVASLPERERLVVHAYYFEEQNAREAAAMLGMSKTSFYDTLRGARARLAERMNTSTHSTSGRPVR